MKIVLDTNVLISGVFWGGTPFKILELWQEKRLEVLASEMILDEYLKCIERISLKYSRPDLFNSWSLILPSRIKLVQVKKTFNLCRDPDDNKFIDCAISGKAHFLVSGDEDLLVLKKVMNLEVLTHANFFIKCSKSG
jgi:putative PIN family toxin of toxin-antitoxin system